MKIKMSRLTLWQNVKLPIGEELDVKPWLAEAMIRRSVAVATDPPAPPAIKEEAKPPDTAPAEQQPDKTGKKGK